MKKFLAVLIILVLCLPALIGCQSSTTTTSVAPAPSSTTSIKTTTTPMQVASTSSSTSSIPQPSPVSVGATASTTTTGTAQSTQVKGGTLTYIDPTTPGGPLGMPWYNRAQYVGTVLTTEQVFKSMPDASLVPYLAESWEIDSNKTAPSLTFHLRKGVKFQDGTDWNAQVFAWNLKKFAEANTLVASRYTKTTTIVDDYTVKLMLTEWRNTLLPAFEMAPIASPAAYDKYGEDYMRTHIVSTGAFVLTDFSKDVKFVAERNPNYWMGGGKPYMDKVQYINVVDELTRLALFKSGTGDVMDLAKNARIAGELKEAGYNIYSQLAGCVVLMPDSANASSPWANLKVREAAEYAIDKAAIAKTFGFGYSSAADQWYPDGTYPHNPDVVGRKYNVAKAKSLMTEAGFPNGFKSKIISDPTVSKDIVVALQSFLKTIGITVDLDFPDATKFTSYSMGTWDNALLCTVMRTSPQPTQGIAFTSEPRVQFKSNKGPPKWMDIYNRVMTTPELDQKVLWSAFQAMFDDVMTIPIMYTNDIFAVTDRVQDGNFCTYGSPYTWNVTGAWLKK